MFGLEADSQGRSRRFVERVLESKTVWGLQSGEGWCQSPSNGEEFSHVMPFWSDRALAAQCARDEWSGYAPTAIALDEFVDAWLPGMAGDGGAVGVNWNAQLIGAELDPNDLLDQLAAKEDPRAGRVHCHQHGDGQQATFVCQHLALTLTTGRAVGFFWAQDPNNPRPDAWCAACDEKVSSTGGEWNDESEGFAKITLMCGACYDRAKAIWEEARRDSGIR